MPLSASEIAALSRLLDEAQELPVGGLQAWLDALPSAQQPLVAHLRRALGLTTAGRMPSRLPHLVEAQLPDAQAGERIGPYRLQREIGRGGMGAVWLAQRADGLYEREVAIKLPRLTHGPELAERMAQERRIGAQLEHPHIARLYDAGIAADGRPYLVLELVRGQPLLEHARTLDRPARLQLMLQACSAVAHAHRQAVVHRDIKPSNLMVDRQGQLKLLDFGIARLLDQDGQAGASGDGRPTHTPGYAAPEQLRQLPATTACDIYALGVVCHELLSGQRTPDEASLAALGRDAAAIVRRATQPRPQDRYPTVEHLAEDLRCLLAQRPPVSDPGPWTHRLALTLRRRRWSAGVGALATLALVAGGVLWWQQQLALRRETQRSLQAREYVSDVLEAIEPMEGQEPGTVTGRQILDSARQSARNAFAQQPVLHGQILVSLGIMFRRFAAHEQTLAVLREGEALLAAHTAADDPELARARGQLAHERMQQGDPDHAGIARQAQAAIDACRGDARRCARAELYARQALRSLAQQGGDIGAAIAQSEAAVGAAERAFGTRHFEVLIEKLQLAITYRNGGRLAPAMQVLDAIREPAAAASLHSGDRVQFQLWDAVLLADSGRHLQAIAALDRMLQNLATPPMKPTLLRMRARSRHQLGQWAAALEDARQALLAGPGRPAELAFSRQAQAHALARSGSAHAALAELQAVDADLQAMGMAQTSVERLRAGRLLAEAMLLAGDDGAAAAQLERMRALHQAPAAAPRSGSAAPVAALDYAQLLQLQATLARRRGDLAAATALLKQASPWLAELPSTHPWRRRQAVELALANDDPQALRQAVQAWIAELPADSGLRSTLQTLPDDPQGRRFTVL